MTTNSTAPGTKRLTATDNTRRVTVEEALARLPGAGGEAFATVLEHGSLSVEIYAPRGTDPQQPHTRDEAYVARVRQRRIHQRRPPTPVR